MDGNAYMVKDILLAKWWLALDEGMKYGVWSDYVEALNGDLSYVQYCNTFDTDARAVLGVANSRD